MTDSKLHIAVFDAHACDGEIMAGATVAKYVRMGHKATFVHLTLGEKGHSRLSAEEYAAQKTEEAKKAAQVIGADVKFLPYKDAELEFNAETTNAVVDVIREIKPDIVITHWKGSFHSDHENTSHIVLRACFLAGLKTYTRGLPAHSVKKVYYGENWEDPYGFKDDYYVEIDDESYRLWREMVTQYELFRGGVSSFQYLQYYEGLFKTRGALGGFNRAEVFMRSQFARGHSVNLLPL